MKCHLCFAKFYIKGFYHFVKFDHLPRSCATQRGIVNGLKRGHYSNLAAWQWRLLCVDNHAWFPDFIFLNYFTQSESNFQSLNDAIRPMNHRVITQVAEYKRSCDRFKWIFFGRGGRFGLGDGFGFWWQIWLRIDPYIYKVPVVKTRLPEAGFLTSLFHKKYWFGWIDDISIFYWKVNV